MPAEEVEIRSANGNARTSGSRLTPDQFRNWKAQKDADASARKAEAARKRTDDLAAGSVQMNGRELFLHEPWVFDDERF